jgi:hypothetical protein
MTTHPSIDRRQSGVVLVAALLLLLTITLVALTSMQGSTLELRMATNEQERMEAFQTAQATIDYILDNPSSFLVKGDVAGYTVCTANLSGCNEATLDLDADVTGSPFDDTQDSVEVTRLDPATMPPPRGLEMSADKFTVANFSVDGKHDAAATGGGYAEIVQGYMRLVPVGAQ